MQKIYLLFSCNEWKEHSSMRLLLATTKESKIRQEIARQVKADNMKYGAESTDIAEKPLYYLNNCLMHGHIVEVMDGELQ